MRLLFTLNMSLLCWFGLHSQTLSISPQVLNSAGGHRQVGNSGVYLTDNVGEPFTETIKNNVSSMMITEGFIQPEVVSQSFTLTAISQSLQCIEDNDAFISLSINSVVDTSKYRAKYIWSPSGICPDSTCARLEHLKAGTYGCTVAISYTTAMGDKRKTSLTYSVKFDDPTVTCLIKVYSGISANNDSKNDFFTIEDIDDFTNNRVSIYNRWGDQLAEIKGYDNNNPDKRWPNSDQLEKLSASTYFYIIDLGNGSKPIKGWVELIKN